ncbi:hypothetical protein PED39_00645 [Methanomassiliicoccales archaeon LGM-RCC1]|nr:hypothetical protein PED39_00645 [Methanomassiliicoccales archaeon LGM-RCC1]
MTTYGEGYGKGMFIGCAFTLVMTLGTLPMLLPAYEGQTEGPIIMTVAYVILGITLGALGFKFRKEKIDNMPIVYGTSALAVGVMFILIGIFGLIANYAIANPIGLVYQYVLDIVIGICAAIVAYMVKSKETLGTMKIVIIILFVAMMAVSCWGIYMGISQGMMVGMPMFNTLMISLVLTVFAAKGGPGAA